MKLPDFLDSELVILWEGNNRLCQFSKKFGIKSSCGIFMENGEGQIVYHLPTDLDRDRDGTLFLKEFAAIKRENMYIVRRSLEDEKLSAAFFDFVTIPSMVMVSATLDGGMYRFVFIFHSSVMNAVSSHLLELSAITPLMVEYLGKSQGLQNILGKINKTVPLLVMKSTGVPPDYEIASERNPVGKSWTRIIKTPLSGESISSVYSSNETPPEDPGMRVSGAIYEAKTHNPVTENLMREDRKYGMIHVMRIHNLNNRLLTVINIFPESFGNAPIKLLAATSEKFPEWKIQITGFWKYEDNPDSI